MKTLRIRYTRGDSCTFPGGFVLRGREEAPRYIVHSFNRAPGSATPASHFWGHYSDSLAEAEEAFAMLRKRACRYDAGGSLIPVHELEGELAAELRAELARPDRGEA